VVGDLRNDADVARAEGVDGLIHIPPNIVEDEHEIGYRVVAALSCDGLGPRVGHDDPSRPFHAANT